MPVLTPETVRERLGAMHVTIAVDEAGQVVDTIACQVVGKNEGHIRGMAVIPGTIILPSQRAPTELSVSRAEYAQMIDNDQKDQPRDHSK